MLEFDCVSVTTGQGFCVGILDDLIGGVPSTESLGELSGAREALALDSCPGDESLGASIAQAVISGRCTAPSGSGLSSSEHECKSKLSESHFCEFDLILCFV